MNRQEAFNSQPVQEMIADYFDKKTKLELQEIIDNPGKISAEETIRAKENESTHIIESMSLDEIVDAAKKTLERKEEK